MHTNANAEADAANVVSTPDISGQREHSHAGNPLGWRAVGKTVRWQTLAVADMIYDADGKAEERAATVAAFFAQRESIAKPSKLPFLTHAEIVDMIPILHGMRSGFFQPPGDAPACMANPASFMSFARERGHGAEICAAFIVDLIHGQRLELHSGKYNLNTLIGRLDSEHRRAIVALFTLAVERGIK